MVEQAVKPGTIGFSRIRGRSGWWIGLGQWIIGDGSRYSHAFVVVDDGQVVEANSKGARIAPLADRLDWRPLAFGHAVPLTDAQRAAVAREARALVGTPYSWADYVALGLDHLGDRRGFRWLHARVAGPLHAYIADSGRMICSQLCDAAYHNAGLRLFDDGRNASDVTPGDLANLMIERDWGQGWRVPPEAAGGGTA